MCLLGIFAAPHSIETMPSLKHMISSQILCLREHIDSLYLKKIFKKDTSTSRPPSQKANGSAVRTVTAKDAKAAQVQSPAKKFAGKEGILHQ